MKTQIRRDINLLNLSRHVNKDRDDLAKHIEARMAKNGHDFNDTYFAGQSLLCYYDECFNGNFDDFALYCLEKTTPKIIELFQKLQIWGTADECPDCGCEMDEVDWKIEPTFDRDKEPDKEPILWKCQNCENVTEFNPK